MSGQILGSAVGDFGSDLGKTAQTLIERQKQIDVDAKAMQSLAKSHPELVGNMDIQKMSPYQLAQSFRGLSQAAQVGTQIGQAAQEQAKANYLGNLIGQKNLSARGRYEAQLVAGGGYDPMTAHQMGEMAFPGQGISDEMTPQGMSQQGAQPNLATAAQGQPQTPPTGVQGVLSGTSQFDKYGFPYSQNPGMGTKGTAQPANAPNMTPKEQAQITAQSQRGIAAAKERSSTQQMEMHAKLMAAGQPVAAAMVRYTDPETGEVDMDKAAKFVKQYNSLKKLYTPAASSAQDEDGADTSTVGWAPANIKVTGK